MSSVDPLLDAPREETHDHCQLCHHWKGGKGGGRGGEGMSWPTYGVLQVAPKERGAGRPHRRRGMHQERKERELIVNEERAGGSSLLLGSYAPYWAF
ncbi:unnamed protein product [Spirodela intermedia]|uniref:Uncharacterized protein n=1 Tax=Spirodela intermedia TaxID=51605 RepID=A0A7I8KA35_SPIIN|nr:unnamed protein product [Spirodela intermedia]